MNKIRFLVLVFLFFAVFFGEYSLFASETPYSALVIVQSHCSFEVRPEGSNVPFKFFELAGNGVGFFVKHDKYSKRSSVKEFVVTAGNVVNCNTSPSFDFRGFEVREFKSIPVVIYGEFEYRARVVKFSDSQNGFENPDEALLEILLPQDVTHGHFDLAEPRNKYSVGEKANIIGLFSLGDTQGFEAWGHIYLESAIAFLNNKFFQLSVQSQPGMSGSPVILYKKRFFWWGRRPVVVGILSLSDAMNGKALPSSWASKVNMDILK